MTRRVEVGGPFFEDLSVGQVLEDAPAVTLTEAHSVAYQALFGDRLRLPLDHELSRAVTTRDEPVVHPGLVWNLSIGQSTWVSQRVLGNLFYRRLVSLRPVHAGDTLRTVCTIEGLRQNRPKPGRPASGMVLLRVRTTNRWDEPVLDFWRCPMIPLRDPDGDTGHADDFGHVRADIDAEVLEAAVPRSWRLEAFSGSGERFKDLVAGTTYAVEGRDTVTSAPGFVRLTLNLARTHTDPGASVYGRRLVYGGHTISMAAAATTRALPNIVTIVAWRSCDHLAPVFEGDVLRTEVIVEDPQPLWDGHGLAGLRVRVSAARAEDPAGEETDVLDWRPVVLLP